MVHDYASVSKSVGMDGNASCSDLLRCLYGLLQEFHIRLLVGRIDQGIICITVESGYSDPGCFSGFFDLVKILVCPAPELDIFKTVISSSLEAIIKRYL